MFSLKDMIFEGKEIKEPEIVKIEPRDEIEVEIEPSEEKETEEEESEEEQKETPREELIEELNSAIEDMTDDELDVLLDYAYAILLSEEEEEDKESEEGEEKVEEALIQHQTPTEKSQLKRIRRTPKWKRKARVRYIRNKKCPAGTSWSSVTKSCGHINIDMSRLQKIISKMKVRSA